MMIHRTSKEAEYSIGIDGTVEKYKAKWNFLKIIELLWIRNGYTTDNGDYDM